MLHPVLPCVGAGGGRIAGRVALQACQDLRQPCASVPQQVVQQGQHGVQGLCHPIQGQAGLVFLCDSDRRMG